MTLLLRACYFSLYYNLLMHYQPAINITTDYPMLIRLLFQLKYNNEENKLLILRSEFEAIKGIIRIFNTTVLDYNEAWWEELIQHVISGYASLPTWEYWNKNNQTPILLMSKVLSTEWTLSKNIASVSNWESYPSYIIPHSHSHGGKYWRMDLEYNINKLMYLKRLVINPDDPICEIIDEQDGGYNYLKYFEKKYKL